MRSPAFCICEKKGVYQPRNWSAPLFSPHSTIPLQHKSEISSLSASSVIIQPGLYRTWSETPEDRFSDDAAHNGEI